MPTRSVRGSHWHAHTGSDLKASSQESCRACRPVFTHNHTPLTVHANLQRAAPTHTEALTCNVPCAALLKKAKRPDAQWQELSPSVEKWYTEVDSLLKGMQDRGLGSTGSDVDKVKRTMKVCMGTIKGVHYWVKDVTDNYSKGTDGPMIAKASAVRLERILAPHLLVLLKNRDECLKSPSTFFTYTMMSVRAAFKDYDLWIDPSYKIYDTAVLEEMERAKQNLARAGSDRTPGWVAAEPYNALRPIALYCDGHRVGAIDPQVKRMSNVERWSSERMPYWSRVMWRARRRAENVARATAPTLHLVDVLPCCLHSPATLLCTLMTCFLVVYTPSANFSKAYRKKYQHRV